MARMDAFHKNIHQVVYLVYPARAVLNFSAARPDVFQFLVEEIQMILLIKLGYKLKHRPKRAISKMLPYQHAIKEH